MSSKLWVFWDVLTLWDLIYSATKNENTVLKGVISGIAVELDVDDIKESLSEYNVVRAERMPRRDK